MNSQERSPVTGQAQQKRRAVMIDTIECESAEAALAVMLIGGRQVVMIFADVRLRGVMDGSIPWFSPPGHPREHVGKLPPGVGYMPKPWQPLNVLIAAEEALASAH